MQSKSERSLGARAAAYQSWAKTSDWSERTAAARRARDARFDREVDPDGTLPETERQIRAVAARKAYFTTLALASVRARQRKSSDG